jgi:hypothetical protein
MAGRYSRMPLSKQDQSALNDLQFHWEEVYLIGYDHQRGLWWARFKATGADELCAGTAEGLRQRIRDDYAGRKCRQEEDE